MKGTLNVLRSCTKVPSIRRVVVTSSIVAMIFNGKPLTPDAMVDETWYSDPAFCEESKVGIIYYYPSHVGYELDFFITTLLCIS